ncbi:MAG: hypothetical protein JNM18_04335, partial [Planctomycetaceae bacterium]|nr:hypothetical protein [Planctomycetaceae bacterium]
GAKFSTEVQLHVSEDRGSTWKLSSRVAPDQREFKFQAPHDGEYWFLVRTRDATGQLRPDGPPLPQMRVLVDTQLPQLNVKALRGPNGELNVKVRASDVNLQLEGAKITYQTVTGEWRNVALETLSRDPEAKPGENVFCGESTFWATDLATGSLIRSEVRDQAGNLTVEQTRVEQTAVPMQVKSGAVSQPVSPATTAAAPATQTPPAPATTPVPTTQPEPPPATASAPPPAAPPVTTPPTAPAVAATPPATEVLPAPATTAQPLPNPTATTVAKPVSTGGATTSPATTPAAPANNTPPTNAVPPGVGEPPQMPPQFGQTPLAGSPFPGQAPFPSLPRPSETLPTTGTVAESLPAPPPINPVNTIPNLSPGTTPPPNTAPNTPPVTPVSTTLPANNAPAAVSNPALTNAATGSSVTPPGVQPRWVNSRRFEMEYDISSAPIETVGKVELWLTRDGGQTWALNGLDEDRKSPHRIEVTDDGVFGFRMVVETTGGLRSAEPRSGDMPDVWIGVDTAKPNVQLLPIEQAGDVPAGQLRIRWQGEDLHLGLRPVTLSFAVDPAGPWSSIASGLDNSGRYDWRIDARVPSKIYLRVEVRDEAGNVAQAISAEPVSLEHLRPRGKILNVRPVSVGKPK